MRMQPTNLSRSGAIRTAIAATFVAIAAGCVAPPASAPTEHVGALGEIDTANATASTAPTTMPEPAPAAEASTFPVADTTSAPPELDTPASTQPEATAPTSTAPSTTTSSSTTTPPTTSTPPTIPAPSLPAATTPTSSLPTPSSGAGIELQLERGLDVPASANSVAQASERVELAEGHTDLIEVTLDAGKLRIQVKDDTKPGGAVFRDPSNVQVRVRDASKISSPAGDQFSFLGAPGTPLYLLPQVQAPNLLWPGWSTERLSTGQVAGDKVTVTMSSFSGPGKLVMFTTNQFGAPNVIFHSGIAGKNKMDVAARVHAHASWAFDQAGEYRMGITATATLPNGTPLTATVTYVMLVGDATPLAPWDTTTTTGPGQTTTAPTTTRPAGVGTAPTTTIASRAPSGSTNSSGGSTEAGAADTSVRGANQTAGGSDPALARTGNDAAVLLRWAAISTAAGICLLAAKRRRTRALPVVVTTRTESSSQ